MVPGAYRNQHQSYDHTSKGHMTRIARSFPGAKSRAGHVFRVEAIGSFAAGQGENSKKEESTFVKIMLIQALHAVAGAGGGNPESQYLREMTMAMWPFSQVSALDASFSTRDPPSSAADGTSGGLPRNCRCFRELAAHLPCGDHDKADHLSRRKSAKFVYIRYHTACGHRKAKRLVPTRTTNVQEFVRHFCSPYASTCKPATPPTLSRKRCCDSLSDLVPSSTREKKRGSQSSAARPSKIMWATSDWGGGAHRARPACRCLFSDCLLFGVFLLETSQGVYSSFLRNRGGFPPVVAPD